MKPSSILLIFLQLCCLQVVVLVSKSTCRLPGNVVMNAHNLLRDLGGPFPVHCRRHNVQIHFPDSALSTAAGGLSQCRWTSLVVYGSLHGAELMFENHDLPEGEDGVSWNDHKLDNYLNLQYRLVEEHPCLNNTEVSAVLSPYFSNVTAVIEQQDSSACGWHALRRDLLWVLKSSLHKHHNCFNWTRAH